MKRRQPKFIICAIGEDGARHYRGFDAKGDAMDTLEDLSYDSSITSAKLFVPYDPDKADDEDDY